jgi:3-oxoacid CoA-transferase subunit A/glutaconate CoA-transferase subunit A
MPTVYYFDEEHIAHWLEVSKTPEGIAQYFEEYVFGVPDYQAYLEKIGGRRRMEELKRVMNLQPPQSGEATP